VKVIEIPLSESEYEQLTAKYALTDTGTRWEALREALNLPGTPMGWHGPYGGTTLSVRSLRPLDKRRHHYPNSGKIARDE
jgi:hypothetical protein